MKEFMEALGALVEIQAFSYKELRKRGLNRRDAALNAAALIKTLLNWR